MTHWGILMRPNLSKAFALTLALLILATCSPNISAQTTANAAANVARITQAVRENDRVTLKGNTHPLASVKNDQGLAPDSLPMDRMLLVLKRSADQEASLKTLMEGQQSKSSPSFHQWLTPDQFGQQFGVSDSDIQTVSAWLQTHGFTVNRVATGKTVIEFSGTAGQVREAFQTQIHKYVVNGEQHWANSSDPSIPSALAPVIVGVNTLHNFKKKAMIQKRGMFSRETATGAVTPLNNVGCNGNSATTGGTCLGVGPADFAAIYHVPATVGGVAAGTGQTLAIVGDSNICTGTPLPVGCTTDDILNFRTLFGLPMGGPTNAPKIILDGQDPGLNSDEIEADLDVEYSGAVAPNAQILLVIAADTSSSNGIDLAAEHIVDFNLAPVMSESFGDCEGDLGNGGNAFYATLWEQAAAQGITVIISSGDNGSASCDDPDIAPNAAQSGLAVNGIASTPFTVAAGGTDFDFTAAGYPASFWSATNGAHGISALGYIPETTWNDSCAQSGVNGCNGLTTSSTSPLLQVVGGSGGQSNCSVQNFLGCSESYAKPTWQSGSGVPNDGVRDLPDISLFSSSGQLSGSFYILCASDIGGTCATGGSSFSFIAVGGTSAAAPAFAGIMALVNQQMVTSGLTSRQGNANFVLYPMSAGQPVATCNSSSIPASNCVFNDVVKGNNSVPCVGGTFACSNAVVNSPNIGVLATVNATTGAPIAGTLGFSTGVGYDLATGLGSINVTNLVSGWPAASGAFSPTATTLTLGPLTACPGGTPAGITNCINITHGGLVNVNVGVTGAGTTAHPITESLGHADDASLIGACQTPGCFLGGASTAGIDRFDAVTGNSDIYPLTSGVSAFSTNELIGGRYNVTAHYAGDGFNGASDSSVLYQVNVSPEGSRSTVSVFGNTTTATSSTYGVPLTVRTDIVGSSTGFETASGQVTLNDTFPGWTPVVLSLNSDGHVELQVPNASVPGNNPIIITVPVLGLGVHNFSAAYAGDASYSASTSVGVPFTITQGPTASTITTSPTSVVANVNFTLVATVATNSFGNAPTGTVSFFAGTTLLGSAPVVAVPVAGNVNGVAPAGGTATFTTAKISANASITAVYNGDVNYTVSAASPAVSVLVAAGPSFTVTSASNPSVTAGSPATSVITVAPTGGFTGTVALTCSVAPTTLTSTPTCALVPASIILGASQTSTLTVTTTLTTSLSAYTVTVTGTSGATVIATPVTVTVQTPGAFTLASTAVTIAAPGQSGTSTITATGTGGFTGAVGLTCSVSGSTTVDLPTCSVGGPINFPAGTTTGTATLTVNTTAASGIPFVPTNNVRPNIRWIVGAGALAMVLMIMMLSFAPMRKRRPAIVLASLFVFVGLMVAGCGSSGGGGGTTNPGTPAGSYTVTVTGTSGTHTATTTVTVTLQ
jgi:trimeric autotransporter adhesin